MNKLDTESRGHHPHSPSSLQSSEACAHFENEQRDSAASIAGTLQHKAAETRDLSILDDPEQVAAVQRALQVEDEWIGRLTVAEKGAYRAGEDMFGSGGPPEIVREKYLPVDASHIELVHHEVGHGEESSAERWVGITGGYPDTVLVQPATGEAAILDWKFGRYFVTPTQDNMQGRAYAAGVFEAFPVVQKVTVVFYHPYLEVNDGGEAYPKPEYQHTFDRSEREFIELQVRTFVARKKLATAEGFAGAIAPTPKTDLCLWCAKKATCPALGQLMVLGASKHKEITVPDVFNPTELTKPEDYAAAYRFANQFELVAKSIKRRVTDAAMKDGIDVPGFALTRRRDPEITNVSELKRVAVETFGLSPEEFDNCANVPITKIDAAIKAKAPKGKGAPTVKAFRDAAQEAGALVMGDGYLYLREVSKEEKPAIEEADLEI
jgi:hypothetical protein